jgi:hypothetical protein
MFLCKPAGEHVAVKGRQMETWFANAMPTQFLVESDVQFQISQCPIHVAVCIYVQLLYMSYMSYMYSSCICHEYTMRVTSGFRTRAQIPMPDDLRQVMTHIQVSAVIKT